MSSTPTVSPSGSGRASHGPVHHGTGRPSPAPSAPLSTQDRSPWLRALLYAGIVITVASGLALILLLVSYFMQVDAWPVFYWFGLFGLPLGFALMFGYVITAAIARRRS